MAFETENAWRKYAIDYDPIKIGSIDGQFLIKLQINSKITSNSVHEIDELNLFTHIK